MCLTNHFGVEDQDKKLKEYFASETADNLAQNGNDDVLDGV